MVYNHSVVNGFADVFADVDSCDSPIFVWQI
jgi:hypothetical protein